jgi:hypothetical protein
MHGTKIKISNSSLSLATDIKHYANEISEQALFYCFTFYKEITLINIAYFSHVYFIFPHTVGVAGAVPALQFHKCVMFLVVTVRN